MSICWESSILSDRSRLTNLEHYCYWGSFSTVCISLQSEKFALSNCLDISWQVWCATEKTCISGEMITHIVIRILSWKGKGPSSTYSSRENSGWETQKDTFDSMMTWSVTNCLKCGVNWWWSRTTKSMWHTDWETLKWGLLKVLIIRITGTTYPFSICMCCSTLCVCYHHILI